MAQKLTEAQIALDDANYYFRDALTMLGMFEAEFVKQRRLHDMSQWWPAPEQRQLAETWRAKAIGWASR